ncbi:Kinesin-related protein 1 [Phytophthora citrophthora]|uniref:Kinesin-related protein 1 n=1 Tax=Phytophthora citrophthora TaxID=4793 RepID=A0AAD9LUA2_9STRA|nr:Kinesin-related protein 1 [Phytophthora citrophthora]
MYRFTARAHLETKMNVKAAINGISTGVSGALLKEALANDHKLNMAASEMQPLLDELKNTPSRVIHKRLQDVSEMVAHLQAKWHQGTLDSSCCTTCVNVHCSRVLLLGISDRIAEEAAQAHVVPMPSLAVEASTAPSAEALGKGSTNAISTISGLPPGAAFYLTPRVEQVAETSRMASTGASTESRSSDDESTPTPSDREIPEKSGQVLGNQRGPSEAVHAKLQSRFGHDANCSSTPLAMNRCGGALRTRFFVNELNTAHSATSEDRDGDNQEDTELFLADDDSEDFNALAEETSSMISCESSSFVCSDQNTITAVRVRPMLPSERKNGYRIIVDVSANNTSLVTKIVNPTSLPSSTRKHTIARYTSNKSPLESTAATDLTFPAQFTQEFWFDYTYWSFGRSAAQQVATQATIYDELGVIALQTLLQGHNCSVFAYGQPGAGKTYTMMGNSGERALLAASVRCNTSDVGVPNPLSTSEKRGLIPRLCQGLFAEIDEGKRAGISSTVIMSYVEIYDERVYDLLSQATLKKSLKVREHPEDGAFVERAQCVRVTSSSQLMNIVEEGNRTRSVASCLPCRPHTVLTISLMQNASMGSGDDTPRKSKLCLVDLAGSERVDHSETSGFRLREAASVNRSLATLADVVGALAKRKVNRSSDQHQKTFAPYRNSVLTRLLKDCLGGRAKTIMIGAISPCCAHYEESISTLKIIERARSIYSTGRLQTDTSGDLTQRFLDEVNELTLDLCASDESSIPLALPNECCGAPECHNECPDCETCNLPEGDNNTPDHTPLKAQVKEITADKMEITLWDDDNLARQVKQKELAQNVHLLNLVAICRRWQTLRLYRALGQWRKFVSSERITMKAITEMIGNDVVDSEGSTLRALPALVRRKSGCPPLHTHTPTSEGHKTDRVQDVVAVVVATDAICCSVVQDFLFPGHPQPPEVLMQQSNTDEESLLEILASSSEFDRSEFRFTAHCEDTIEDEPLEELALPKGYASDEDKLNLDSEFDALDLRQEIEIESNGHLLSPELLHDERSVHSTLALCMDSIDMARRALGPGVHNLRATRGTGVEYDLLRYLDKKLIAMTQNFEDLLANLQWIPSRSTCEGLETVIGEFCLQIVARLCDQLPSVSSACIAGRLQLESQLERFGNCLRQQLLPEIARGLTGEEANENGIISLFSVATELLVMTERITLVWTLVGHQKRERLLQAQALEASTIRERKMAAKIAALEERNVELSAKLDVLLATNSTCRLNGSIQANTRMTHDKNLGAKQVTLEHQLTELENINLEQRSELERIKADLSFEQGARSKAESDAALLLTRASELERQVAHAEVRFRELEVGTTKIEEDLRSVNAALMSSQEEYVELSTLLSQVRAELSSASEKSCLENEIVLQAVTIDEQILLLKKAQIQRESAEMLAEDILMHCVLLVDSINTQISQITALESRISQDKQHSLEVESSLAASVQDRDELVLLLSQTEEALSSALNREKGLQSQLLGPISRESEDMNRVRGELHETTLELASLREELAELLDHSTLQSATIEALTLEHDKALRRIRDIESERDDVVLECQKERCVSKQREEKYLALAHGFAEEISKLERQQETEREQCMAIHEALQRQTSSFQKVQGQQHSIKMDHCSTIRHLKGRIDTLVAESRFLTAELAANAHELEKTRVTAKVHIQQIETQSKLSILNLEDQVSNLIKKLHECKQDLKSTVQNWI